MDELIFFFIPRSPLEILEPLVHGRVEVSSSFSYGDS